MSGCPRAVFDRICTLRERHEVEVLTFVTASEQSRVSDLERLGVQVHGVAWSDKARESVWRKRARLMFGLLTGRTPMLAQEFYSPEMRERFKELASGGRFDLVLVEHILMAQYLDALPEGGPTVVLSEHDVRLALPSKTKQSSRVRYAGPEAVSRLVAELDRGKWRRYEKRSSSKAARVWVPSEQDKELLSILVPENHIRVVPIGMAATAQSAPSEIEARDRDSVVFVGNFDHEPNRDAASWLAREILPLVWREVPTARLTIVGMNPTPDVRALVSSRVAVTGAVPTVAPYLDTCAVFAAPVRLGGGTRMKIIEAMQHGAPVVTTTLGAQGLAVEDGRELLTAQTTEELAEAVVRLLKDPELARQIGENGHSFAISVQRDRAKQTALFSALEEAEVAKEAVTVKGGATE